MWQNIILMIIFHVKNSVNNFLFILKIRSIAELELIPIDSQGMLMINILIHSQT